MRGIPSLLTILVLVFGNGLALADEPRLELFVQTGHTQWVMGVAISGDGKYVVTGSYDKTAILWEAASGKKLQSFRGHRGFINSVAISADGKFVVSGSDDRTAILWEAASGKKLQALQGHKDAVRKGWSGGGKRAGSKVRQTHLEQSWLYADRGSSCDLCRLE